MTDDVLDEKLLAILACPENREAVHLADAEVLERVNARIRAGDARNRGGEEVRQELDAALVREDGKVLYPVRDGIPIMLMDESLEV